MCMSNSDNDLWKLTGGRGRGSGSVEDTPVTLSVKNTYFIRPQLIEQNVTHYFLSLSH